MSIGIVAAVAGVGATVYSASQSGKAADKQAAAANSSVEVQREQLQFDMDRYNEWKGIYGPLQEDLGTYYKNLTGKSISKQEVEQLQLASQKANKKLEETMAQRGMSNSGLEMQLLGSNTYNTEIAKATVTANADQKAADLKQNFLSIGLGTGSTIAGQMSSASNGLASGLINAGQANSAGNMLNSGLANGVANTAFNLMGQYGTNWLNDTNTSAYSRDARA